MRILVATDGSRAAAAAVRFASTLAAGDNGENELIVLTVYAGAPAGEADDAEPREDAKRALADAGRILRGSGSPPARFDLIRARNADGVPEAISRQADRLRADLVVVGSEGRDSLAEWVVGGTALRLIYVAHRPVTVVRAPRRRGARDVG